MAALLKGLGGATYVAGLERNSRNPASKRVAPLPGLSRLPRASLNSRSAQVIYSLLRILIHFELGHERINAKTLAGMRASNQAG